MFAPDFANRPAGFYNLFTGAKALAFFSPIGGNFLAPAEIVSIQSKTPLVLAGGTANGQVATEISAGIVQSTPSHPNFAGGFHHIGLLRSWLQ